MAEKIAVINQKGGVGKTTTAYNLASTLARYNKKVLLIDLDPQGNACMAYGIDISLLKRTVADLLLDEANIRKVVKKTNIKLVSILPSNLSLALVETKLLEKGKNSSKNRLKEVLEDRYTRLFDYIIIDCPPSLGYLSLNALNAADSLIIPVQCEYFALDAIAQLLATIISIQRNSNPSLEIMGLLMTMYDPRINLSLEIASKIRAESKDKVFTCVIPRNVSIPVASMKSLPVNHYKPSSKGSLSYLALAREVMEYVEQKKRNRPLVTDR